MNSVRIDVNDITMRQIDSLAEKERWSKRKVVVVALENYLKSRGCEVSIPIDQEDKK